MHLREGRSGRERGREGGVGGGELGIGGRGGESPALASPWYHTAPFIVILRNGYIMAFHSTECSLGEGSCVLSFTTQHRQ